MIQMSDAFVAIDVGTVNMAMSVWRRGSDEVVCYKTGFSGNGRKRIDKILAFLDTHEPRPFRVVIEAQTGKLMAKIEGAIYGFYYSRKPGGVATVQPVGRSLGLPRYSDRKKYVVGEIERMFGMNSVTAGAKKMDDIADAVVLLARNVPDFRATTLRVVFCEEDGTVLREASSSISQ